MNFMQRFIGGLRQPGVDKQGSPASLKEIREAIEQPGDDAAELIRLLGLGGTDLNTVERTVYPVISHNGVVVKDHGAQPLILAAMLHKPERLKALLDRGASVAARCGLGRTALHWAIVGEDDATTIAFGRSTRLADDAQRASLRCTRYLIEHGADVDAADHLQYTPLHRACMVDGKLEHIRLLLSRQVRLDGRCNPDLETPLLIAVRAGLLNAATALLEGGAQGNVADRHARGPLHWACATGKAELADLLLRRGADPNLPDGNGNTPAALAISSGSIKSLRLVQEAGAPAVLPPGWQIRMLVGALTRKDEASLQALLKVLDLHALDDAGGVFWHHALAQRDVPDEAILDLIDRRGASIRAAGSSGDQALHVAVQVGKAAMVSALLSRGAEIEAGNWRPLHHAARGGNIEIAQVLLRAGADIFAVADQWKTPIAVAVAEKHHAMVECLAEAHRTKTGGIGRLPGISPLSIACEVGDLRTIETLLRNGVDVDAPSRDGWTPLVVAVGHPGDEIVLQLLRAGADPNAPSEAGYTALHRAAATGRSDLVRLLVRHGADPALCDLSGATLHDFAKSSPTPATAVAVADVLPTTGPLTQEALAVQVAKILTFHLERSAQRLTLLEHQGVTLVKAAEGQRNDVEHPWIVQFPGLGTGIAAVYRYLGRCFGPRARPTSPQVAARDGWVVESVVGIKHPDRHIQRMDLTFPSRDSRASIYVDVTACAPPLLVGAGLLAHRLANQLEL